MTSVRARRGLLAIIGTIVTAVLVGGLLLFEPWKLVVDRVVDEPAPAPAPPAAAAGAAAPVVLAQGELIGHEHASSGTAVVVRLADGSRVLRLEDLDTSDGPLLKVWLTDAPVIEGTDGWYVFDDGAVVDLGELRGNIGSSNYPIPPEVDLDELTSVSIWCDRFDVSFAAAALEQRASP